MAVDPVFIKDAFDVAIPVAADGVDGNEYQYVKITFGADGTATIVDATTGLPVSLLAGSNLIGQVDLNSVPAAARTTDTISAALASDAVMINNTVVTPKFFKASVATAQTDASVITAVGGKKLRVLAFRIHVAGTAQTVTFNSKPAGAGTAISEPFACGANGGHTGEANVWGHFETATGEGLTVTTAAGGSTSGIGGVYVEV